MYPRMQACTSEQQSQLNISLVYLEIQFLLYYESKSQSKPNIHHLRNYSFRYSPESQAFFIALHIL